MSFRRSSLISGITFWQFCVQWLYHCQLSCFLPLSPTVVLPYGASPPLIVFHVMTFPLPSAFHIHACFAIFFSLLVLLSWCMANQHSYSFRISCLSSSFLFFFSCASSSRCVLASSFWKLDRSMSNHCLVINHVGFMHWDTFCFLWNLDNSSALITLLLDGIRRVLIKVVIGWTPLWMLVVTSTNGFCGTPSFSLEADNKKKILSTLLRQKI